jgi:hypothetical protein
MQTNIKSFKTYFYEAQTKTKTKSKIDLGPDLDTQHDQPLANRTPDREPEAPAAAPERKKASAAQTAQATQGIHTSHLPKINADAAARFMAAHEPNDDEWDGFPDEEPETLPSTQVNTENLPAVAGHALQATGTQNPDFHKVSNLRGNMSDVIRTLGKAVFASLTRTNTRDIWMVGNLPKMERNRETGRIEPKETNYPNSTAEVNAVANWAKKHGEDIGPGSFDMPDMFDTPQTFHYHQYSAAGIRWLLVNDIGGTYVYSWPESDSIQHTNARELGHDRPRLA